MENRIMCAGVGGQGILTLGMVIAQAAASEGKNVTYIPEYGGSMRGGQSTVKIKVSDDTIINPFMESFNLLVALDEGQLRQFIGGIEEDGVLIVERDLVPNLPEGLSCTVLRIPATHIANELGNPKGMSLVVVGAIIATTDMFPLDVATNAVVSYFEQKHIPVEKNKAAFIAGYNYIKEQI